MLRSNILFPIICFHRTHAILSINHIIFAIMKIFLTFFAASTCALACAQSGAVGSKLLDAGVASKIYSDSTVSVCPGVEATGISMLKADGSPLRLYVVDADLNRPELAFEVATPGDTCVASGTQRATLSEMAASADRPGHRVVAMVNADFWDVKTNDVRGPLHRRGVVVKDHFVYTPRLWQQALSFIGVTTDGYVTIADTLAYHGAADRLREATGAGVIVLRNGALPPVPEKYIDPRTCIGYTSKGHVLMLTADGRDSVNSVGLTYPEMGAIMQSLGCISAVNFDGGGSAQMLLRRPDGGFEIRNRPSDGKERPVINGWMIVSNENI